jgi:hypothetical protein
MALLSYNKKQNSLEVELKGVKENLKEKRKGMIKCLRKGGIQT